MTAAAKTDPNAFWTKFFQARYRLCDKMPYLRTIMLSLIPEEKPGLGTMAVTKNGVLLLDPEDVMRLSLDGLVGSLYHEVCHWMRKHFERLPPGGAEQTPEGAAIRKLWNMAGDLAINWPLEQEVTTGIRLSESDKKLFIFPSNFKLQNDLLEEEYYRLLRKKAASAQAACKALGVKPQPSPGAGDGQDAGGEGGPDEADGAGKGKGKNGAKGQAGGGRCGGCSGNPGDGEEEAEAANGGGHSPRKINAILNATAEAIQQAACGKEAGNLPAGLKLWADGFRKPAAVPWQQVLARRLRGAVQMVSGRMDYTRMRPNRRHAVSAFSGGPIMPGMLAWKPSVGIALDTSGSMGGEPLEEAMTEIDGCLKALGTQASFFCCDTETSEPRRVTTFKDAQKLLKGGGGTDFRPIFEQARKLKPKINLLVILTDGFGPAPESAPEDMAVLWVLVGEGVRKPCAWAEVVETHRKG